jgi:hypothetical protein
MTQLTEQEQREKVRINQQAFLMFNYEELVKKSSERSYRFKNFAQVEHPEPAELNNVLFKKPLKFDILLQSKSAHLSYFIPKIRLFKQYYVSPSETVDIELPIYKQYSDQDFKSIFQNKEGRGGGVGLKSFKWNTIGDSPGNQYSFGSEIQLIFESIGEITKTRSTDIVGTQKVETSFADLLVQKKGSSAVYDLEYFRIKAEIGWAIPPGNVSLVPKDMVDELRYSNLTLFMTLHSHEINIEDDSTVTLTLKYISYVEALTDNPKNSNIFYPAIENYESQINGNKKVIEKNKKEIEGDEKSGIPPANSVDKKNKEDTIKTAETAIRDKENENKTKVYSRFLNYIYTNKMMHYLIAEEKDFQTFTSLVSKTKQDLSSEEQIKEFNSQLSEIKKKNKQISPAGVWDSGPQLSIPENDSKKLTEQVSQNVENYNKILTEAAKASDQQVVIPYFYLGDLIEAVIEEMYNVDSKNGGFLQKQLKILLGPIIFYDYGRLVDDIVLKAASLRKINPDGSTSQAKIYTGAKTVLNISDIPISLDIYTAWFTNKIVDAGVVNRSLRDFIGDIITDLVIRAVGQDTYAFAPRQKTRLVYKTKTLAKESNRFSQAIRQTTQPVSFGAAASSGQNRTYTWLRFPATSLKLYDTEMSANKQTENFVLIYAISDQQFELLSDYEQDKKRGIRHVFYGAETGLLKTVKFSRQDNPDIRSHNMRMASQQNSNRSIILREVYNADIEMYGNNLFEMGELLYVSPTLFGSNTSVGFAKDLGIGGYFMILNIENIIQDGSYVTNLKLIWNAKGDGKPLQINDGLVQ